MTILGLDLALRTGWARVRDGRVFDSGVLDFRRARDGEGGHNGHAFDALYRWLDQEAGKTTQIAYELAHHRGGPATRLACGWQATVHLFCARRGLPPPLTVHTATLKLACTGSGRADKTSMAAWAQRHLGRPAIDDNEADAVAVAVWAGCRTEWDAQ